VGAPVCGGRIHVEGSSSLYGHFVIEFELWKHDCTIDGDGKTTMTSSNHHQADDELRQWVKDPAKRIIRLEMGQTSPKIGIMEKINRWQTETKPYSPIR